MAVFNGKWCSFFYGSHQSLVVSLVMFRNKKLNTLWNGANKKVMNANQNLQSLSITGPCYRGVWLCIAGVWDLQTTSFEIPWFLGQLNISFWKPVGTWIGIAFVSFCSLFLVSKPLWTRILEAVKDAFHWLDPNPLAEAEEIEEICAPILSKYYAGQQDDVDDESDEMIHDELWAASKELARDSLFGMRIKFRNISMIPFAMGFLLLLIFEIFVFL